MSRKFAENRTETDYNYSIESWLPLFPGFYNTCFEPDTERIEDDCMYYLEEHAGYENLEFWLYSYDQRPILDFWDNLYTFDTEVYENKVAESVTEFVQSQLRDFFESLGGEDAKDCIKVEYQSVQSPREYNFRNDSINVRFHYNDAFLETLINTMNEQDNRSRLSEYFEEQFKSRDGFISFYPHTVKEWQSSTSNWTEFDQAEFGAILEALLCCLYEGDYVVEDDYGLLLGIGEDKTIAESEATTIKPPTWDELPDAVKSALGALDAVVDKTQNQLTAYIERLPHYAEKSRKDHNHHVDEIKTEYVNILMEYVQNGELPEMLGLPVTPYSPDLPGLES